jgi:regulator of nucleoside diphosphate kinase
MTPERPRITEQDHRRLTELLERLPPPGGDDATDVDTLARRLRDAAVVPIEDVPRSLVTMHSLVGLRDLAHNRKLTCRLVYPEQADVVQHKVSVAAPLGSRILGSAVGDVVSCPVDSDTRELRIEAVYYQPEAARDYHL